MGKRLGVAAAWTGDEMVVVSRAASGGRAAPNTAAQDPAAGQWRPIAQYQGQAFPGRGIVWSERELLV